MPLVDQSNGTRFWSEQELDGAATLWWSYTSVLGRVSGVMKILLWFTFHYLPEFMLFDSWHVWSFLNLALIKILKERNIYLFWRENGSFLELKRVKCKYLYLFPLSLGESQLLAVTCFTTYNCLCEHCCCIMLVSELGKRSPSLELGLTGILFLNNLN